MIRNDHQNVYSKTFFKIKCVTTISSINFVFIKEAYQVLENKLIEFWLENILVPFLIGMRISS